MARTPSAPPQNNKDEREIFHLLKDRLSDEWTFWHEPELKRSYDDSNPYRPDFILLHRRRGLFVLEVKGWNASSILDVKKREPDDFDEGRQVDKVLYQFGTSDEWVPAPFDQLRNYTSTVRQALQKLVAKKKANKLFKGAVCFVRIAEDDLRTDSIFETRLNKLLKGVLTSKRKNEQGYYEGDYRRWRAHPNELQQSLSASPNEDLQLDKIYARIRQIIHPESVISVLSSSEADKVDPGEQQLEPAIHAESNAESVPRVLDLDQEEVAKRYIGHGHRILFGVAGSGKTVILIARARYQAMRHPEQDILVLCFNRTLSFYIQNALKAYRNISVRTFHSWAWSNFPKNPTDFTNKDEYDKELMAHLEREGVKRQYDCILIDESQDWHIAWFRAVLRAAKDAEKGDMLIVGDGSQSIYARQQGFTWKACGINAQGRVINRRGGKVNTFRNYRNTPEIVALATSFAQGLVPQEDTTSEDGMMSLLPEAKDCGKPKSGILPVIFRARDERDELNRVYREIKYLLQAGLATQNRDIVVIYPHVRPERRALLDKLTKYLNKDYQADWIESEKRNQDRILDFNTIKISNVHQIKGLEFKVCFVIWANDFNADEGQLLYVALTRATERLYVTHHADTNPTRKLTSDMTLYTDQFLSSAA